MQLCLHQQWLMEAVGDKAVIHFSKAPSKCQAAVVSSNRRILNRSRSASLTLVRCVNASVLASRDLGAPASPERHRGLLDILLSWLPVT